VREFDAKNLVQLETIFGAGVRDPECQKAFGEWFGVADAADRRDNGRTVEP